MSTRNTAVTDVHAELSFQDHKWGSMRDHHPAEWLMILGEEVGECNKAALEQHFIPADNKFKPHKRDFQEFRNELVQVAAVAIAAIESMDAHYGTKSVKFRESEQIVIPNIPKHGTGEADQV